MSEIEITTPLYVRRRLQGRRLFEARILPALFLLPAGIFVFGLTVWPVFRAFQLSFTDANLAMFTTGVVNYVGLDQYISVFTSSFFRSVILRTALFGIACVALTMTVGISVSLLLNRDFKGRTILAILVILPWAVPRVAAAIVWQWIFHDQFGLMNWLLYSAGFESFRGFAWFNQSIIAFTAIAVVIVWQSFPFIAVSMLAGLQSIPGEIHDAAMIDGASAWQRIMNITLPMLKSLVLVLTVISTIWAFKIFDQVFVMTGGGPARQTELLAITTWREAFTQHNFGRASALAMVMFFILAGITAVYLRLIREEEA